MIAQYAMGDQILNDFDPLAILATLALLALAVGWKLRLRQKRRTL